ncbi:MAG: hypothetical protein IT447_12860 [Phycisphaerales bacterium]|jgi:hypothetical protein|nr:hypothetical protein [Phycisphaerales bacterium]
MSTEPGGELTPNPNEPRPALGLFVRLALLLTAVLFLLAVSILCYRWIIDREPSSLVILNGSDALEGVVAHISGVGMAQPIEATFEPQEKYILKFHLAPGNYTLSLTRGDQNLFQLDFNISARHVQMLDLWRQFPSTRPSALSEHTGESEY